MRRHATSCDFVFTINVTATVNATAMWLQPEINVFIFPRRCTRLQPITMQESVWAWSTSCGFIVHCYFYVFRFINKGNYCLPSYFYLNMSISYIAELEWRTKSTSVNKNMTKLWRHWVTGRFCRSHITVVIVNNALTRRRCVRIVRYDTRRYFNVRSKADTSQLNLPHGTNN